MNLLSDDDKALLVLEHLGPAALAGDTMSLYDCFQLALDVAEKAVLEKLAAKELPEPAHFVDACDVVKEENCKGCLIHCTRLQDVFTAADNFDADMAITTGELSKMIPALIDALGGEVV